MFLSRYSLTVAIPTVKTVHHPSTDPMEPSTAPTDRSTASSQPSNGPRSGSSSTTVVPTVTNRSAASLSSPPTTISPTAASSPPPDISHILSTISLVPISLHKAISRQQPFSHPATSSPLAISRQATRQPTISPPAISQLITNRRCISLSRGAPCPWPPTCRFQATVSRLYSSRLGNCTATGQINKLSTPLHI